MDNPNTTISVRKEDSARFTQLKRELEYKSRITLHGTEFFKIVIDVYEKHKGVD